MKRYIGEALVCMGIIGLCLMPGALEKGTIGIGQVAFLSALLLAVMCAGGKIGSLFMKPEKKKRPARRQPCKATRKNIHLQYSGR